METGRFALIRIETAPGKFAPKFGKTYTLDYDGLSLDVVDFQEPDVPEKMADGTRRGPRSSIGNSNSVWLSHQSAVDLMANLGFPHHETVSNAPRFPRLRTCFFRTQPRPLEPLGSLINPLGSSRPSPSA